MKTIAQWLQECVDRVAATLALGLEPPLVAETGPAGAQVYFAANEPGQEPQRTVRATRRSESQTDASQRKTADAGTRDDGPSSGGGAPPPSMRPSGGLRVPGGRRGGISWIVLLIAVAFVLVPRLFGGGGSSDTGSTEPVVLPEAAQQEGGFEQDQGALAEATPAAADGSQAPQPVPTFPASTSGSGFAGAAGAASSAGGSANTAGGDRWLIMMYEDADDHVLEQDITIDVNEAELAGSTENVQIVAQVDRFDGAYSGDGNWTSTKRFEITRDEDLNRITSREVADLGEQNMADGQTLVDFVKWAVETYPADKYALVLSDHGMGWPGGWSDPTSNERGDRQFPLSSALGDMLYLHELDAALTQAREESGIDKFELVGMDACLMADVAVFTMLADHARYAVASQETEPALGWAYAAYLDALNKDPAESGAGLGEAIVQTYVGDDERVGGNRAQADKIARGTTLTAVDLSKMDALNQALNGLAVAMQQVKPRAISQARSYAQSFTNVFGSSVPPAYIDLGHFALLVAQASQQSPEINSAVTSLVEALSSAVVAEKSGDGKPGATGMSIYFPNSQLYESDMAGPASYNVAASRFVDQSLWDEFLQYFYTGQQFEASDRATTATVAESGTRAGAQVDVVAPAAGGISLSPITLSKNAVAPGDTVLLSADVSGENIGFIKFLVGQMDPNANSILWVDSDYLQAGETREVNGVYYPDWGEGGFRLEFEWEPFRRGISDGQTTAEALFTPQEYGLAVKDAVYTVDGMYTYADGTQRQAKAYFRGGELQQFFGFTDAGDATGDFVGAPREITPAAGDTFTVFEQWVDLDPEGKVTGTAYEAGKTVTLGSEPLKWEELNLPPGQYVIGFIVEDLDGNAQASYTPVTVTTQ